MYEFIKEVLFFVILINPVSKIVLVNMLPHKIHNFEITKLLIKSSLIAYAMLVSFAFGGTFILNDIFQIKIEALQMTGGFILAIVGFRALDKGILFNINKHKSLLDMAIVPLVSPLLAGPATLAATIIKSSIYSPLFVSIVILTSLLIILLLSFLSLRIKHLLDKFNLMGALIRITGVFIMSMGINMMMVAWTTFF